MSGAKKSRPKKFGIKADLKSLRFKLTAAFVIFALILMGGIWIFQSVLLEDFYQSSMRRKASEAVHTVSTVYENSDGLSSYEVFSRIVEISKKDDIYFYIEDSGRTFGFSSSDSEEAGRVFSARNKLISRARTKLRNSGTDSVNFIINVRDGERMLVFASRICNTCGDAVYLYAVAPLTLVGPTAGILSDLFSMLTVGALILGGIIALINSKRMTRPITEMNEKAKRLGKGDYSVRFNPKTGYTEMDELAVTLNAAAEDLGKADALQKDLLANVSHDLRTPLTMVKSYAEMIRDISGDDKERRDEHLGVIIEEADRLSDLVGDILFLSKMQSGTMDFEMEPFDIQAAAESILNTYRVLESENYSFEFIRLKETPMVNGSESRIQQVFSNLLSNAVRYSRKGGGHIKLGFEAVSDKKVRCFVEDDGIGVAKEDLENIWSRYQRASKQSARAKSGGTGLGLSIVKEILEYHGASYGVESKEGEGSSFWFVLDCKFETSSKKESLT